MDFINHVEREYNITTRLKQKKYNEVLEKDEYIKRFINDHMDTLDGFVKNHTDQNVELLESVMISVLPTLKLQCSYCSKQAVGYTEILREYKRRSDVFVFVVL